MLLETLSTPLTKALASNSPNVAWSPVAVQASEPVGDGIFVAGLGGAVTCPMLVILPFSQDGVGGQYYLRVYGWWHFGAVDDAANVVWVPLEIATLLCTSGPQQGVDARLLPSNQNFAGKLELVGGSLGHYGGLTSSENGEGIAYARVPLVGCRKFQFDFAPGPTPMALGNALFAKTTAY